MPEGFDNEARAVRIGQAIKESRVKQVGIATYCGVTKQSVGTWKRNGRITSKNLLKVSEITGFRYIWLKRGVGQREFTDMAVNAQEYRQEECIDSYVPGSGSLGNSDEGQELLESVALAVSKKRVSSNAIMHLSAFFRELSQD